MSERPGTANCPYPGIRPFREDEEFLFFGREAQVDAMVDTLARRHFLAVIGSSGCGKSSLVNCGLRPALHRGLLTRAGSAWRIASCRPGSQPLRALAEALADAGAVPQGASPGPFSPAELLEATLAMSRLGLVEAYRQAALPAGCNLLVIVDQFEELFRYRALADRSADSDEDPATAFVNLLLEARAQDLPIHIVLTMRSDFLGDCARFAGLPEAINGGQYLVPRMSRDERRAAIVGPARVFGADIAPTLLTRLVNDVGDDPDQLSLLQHALARTWRHWRASGAASPIEAAHYDAIGTLAHALNQHAEEIFAALPASGQRLCAAAFRALTDKSTDSRGIRRPTRFADLAAIGATPPDELAAVLAPFRATGSAFLMPPEGDPLRPDTIVDLAHESLMRIWERLREWGERESEAARMLRRLGDAAELHAAGQASLWRDPELQFALDWQARNPPTPAWARQYGRPLPAALAFLDASRQARNQAIAAEQARAEAERRINDERRRNRRVWRLAVAGSVAATLVAGVTGVLWQRAEKAGELALSRQLAAQSASELGAGKLDRALLLAAAGFARQPSFEARDSLLAALAPAPRDWAVAGQQGILALAASPDGRLLASGGRDGSIKLWQQPDGKLLATLRGHQDQVLALAFAPDGSRLASAGIDYRVILWDVATARPAATHSDHEGAVLALAYSPDGQTLASAGADRRIVLRDGHSGAPRGPVLEAHGDTVTSLAFSPDGTRLASTGYDGSLFLWAPGESPAPRLRASHPAVLHGVAFSPDGKLLASAGADRHVLLWEAATLRLQDEALAGHDAGVRKLAFSPDGRHLVSVGDDGQVLVHDLNRPGSIGSSQPGHRGNVLAVAFGSGDAYLTGGADDLLIRHDIKRRGPLTTPLPQVSGSVWAMAFSPDGQRLASAGQDARLQLRDARSGAPLGPPRDGHTALVSSLAFSPDGRLLASAGQDGRLLLWTPADGAPPRELLPAGPPLHRAAFSPDGHLLAAAGRDGRIRLWTLPAATPAGFAPEHGGPVTDLAFAPDSQRLASAGYDGRARLWRTDNGQPAGELPAPEAGALYRIAWTADGQHLAAASQKQGLLLWPLAGGPPGRFGKEASALLDLALSPDGRSLATADKDGAIRLWDVATRQPLHAPLLRHRGPALAMAWTPDGRSLASAGWDKGLMLSRTAPDDWVALACRLAGRNPPASTPGELPDCPKR